MTTLFGVDCATVPRKTGLALGELSGEIVRITKCRTASAKEPPAVIAADWLSTHERVIIAIDAPLGWPVGLRKGIGEHSAGDPLSVCADEMFRRATDLEIEERLGKRPLEVGANLIARTAAAALGFLEELRNRTGREIPIAWDPDQEDAWRAIEVYPAATRIGHGAPDRGGSLNGLGRLLDCTGLPAKALKSKDAVDATVCALAAADFLRGRSVAPVDVDTARIEGWIWAPRAR
ncbi:DUF429 domain-containing protein [Candidatus Fermentibacteria bacterium]|nr:DUF429 domain-containing protein [Candidatus Fermentibacteria bacterium]